MTSTEAELNERIHAEKRLAALEYQSEAWADGIAEGIDPEILAAAALETASVVDEELEATSRLQAIVGRRNFFMVEVLSGDRTL